MNSVRKFTLNATIGAFALGGAMAAAPPADTAETWVLGSAQPGITGMAQTLSRVFIPRLENFSNGEIKVDAQFLTGLCSEHVCIEQMSQNLIQLSTSSIENAGAFGTDLEILNLPYVFKDLHWANQITYDWLLDELNVGAEKNMNLRLLGAIVSGGYRQTINNLREVRVPDDLGGIKIRVTKSPAAFNLFKAWGANPVPYDWAQLYMGLQSKVVNGMYIPTPWVEVTKMYEVANHITYTGGAIVFNGLYMDAKFYRGLKPELKKAVDMAADSFQRLQWAYDEMWTTEYEQRLVEKGVKFYSPTEQEMDLWRAKSVAVWQDQMKIGLDTKLVRRVLEEQSMDKFIKALEDGGVL